MGLIQGKLRALHSKLKSNDDTLLRATEKWFRDQGEIEIQRGCLRALYFRELEERRVIVKSAHRNTFKWILEDSKDDEGSSISQESKFRTWLLSDDPDKNIFWVAGKPGAGKSTLMKFLARHPLLENILQCWAAPQELLVVEYFFWKPGSPLQKSLKGLLRSLLYQILGKYPNHITHAFPDHEWTINSPSFEFSLETLYQALQHILSEGFMHNLRMIFFIDGLDEFGEYDHHFSQEIELIEFLRVFRGSPRVKICVSSRPWPGFIQEFGQTPDNCFYLHELTRRDIKIYIEETLAKNTTFQSLAAEDQDYLKLIDEMIEAAQGVFLWVHIVSRSLLAGITKADRIWTLQDKSSGPTPRHR
ncbi:hypothetical protein K505DRAFT_239158 [Melanomma pulvis-pyrius CBS 109.77]|uniref:Nephrocystin 3-like N-terminal domain-containing protein n=1 Tax=Melanomma pulvis-pyrius CBS 109.77 TaxID=1314802 RepID=A0A6A6XHR0_9PLEO|nr:hypothetical protein K505DRAFT_239158 [Melanomma pulvis-pyrius CBS 109.77]